MRNSAYSVSTFIICLSVLLLVGCNVGVERKSSAPMHEPFEASSLLVKQSGNVKMVNGQVIYLPVYSNVPYFDHGKKYDLSAFVAVHNTDFGHAIKLTKVLFFNNDGKLVTNYLKRDTIIQPLGAVNFFVPEKDQSGTGANFVVEWVSDNLVTEPIVESVMLGIGGGQGISLISSGKIVREEKR